VRSPATASRTDALRHILGPAFQDRFEPAHELAAGPTPQTVQTASYGANRLGLEAREYVFIDLGGPDEECVKVISVDPDNQSISAIVTRDHAAGERVRPTIWPMPVLHEGDDLGFDILGVASTNPGSDLTVVIQT
jgi:hypothetical protein